jgi:hypothetical protein
MKTVIIKSIDGIEYVSGFDVPVLDPETTKQKAAEQLLEDEEFKTVMTNYIAKMQQKEDEYLSYCNKCRVDKTFRTKAAYDVFQHSQNQIQQELIQLAKQIKEARDKAFDENRTYFEPKLGEYTIEDSLCKSLINAARKLRPNERINLDGDVIQDNRGRKYYTKDGEDWHENHIEKFGDKKPKDALYKDGLSDNQKLEIEESKEIQRIRALSEENKQAEMDALIQVALHNAAIKMNELELENELNPKEKAKEWLDQEKQKILDKYSK